MDQTLIDFDPVPRKVLAKKGQNSITILKPKSRHGSRCTGMLSVLGIGEKLPGFYVFLEKGTSLSIKENVENTIRSHLVWVFLPHNDKFGAIRKCLRNSFPKISSHLLILKKVKKILILDSVPVHVNPKNSKFIFRDRYNFDEFTTRFHI